jgi:serine protease Do
MFKTFAASRKTVLGLVAAGLLGSTVLTTTQFLPLPQAAHAATMLDPTKSLAPLVEQVMPSVISVKVTFAPAAAQLDGRGEIPPQMREFFDRFPQFRDQFQQPERRRGGAQGSGFVISTDGYAVTNNHVVNDAAEVKVTFENGDEFDATVVGTDSRTDLALLKIKSDKTFTPVKLATTQARVGDWVMAVGNPFGLGGTVTTGIVSARGRDIGMGSYDEFLQIDASINHGNSGGPTFNLDGEVVGVNTAIFSPSGGSVGIGFAIPASIVSSVIDDLKANGAVTRGWLGVQIQTVSEDLAEGLGLDKAEGAIISDLTENSPAAKAGLKQGDTILKANGETIDDSRDLARTIAKVKPGAEIDIAIIRDGKPQTISVTIGTMPSDPKMAGVTKSDQGFDLSKLGLEIAPADDGAGVKVTKVEPGSAAADRGITSGDVILEVSGKPVESTGDVAAALQDKGKRVLLLIRSADGGQRFVALPREKS